MVSAAKYSRGEQEGVRTKKLEDYIPTGIVDFGKTTITVKKPTLGDLLRRNA